MTDFIDDIEQSFEGVSLYRKLDPENINDYYKFPNQTRDPRVAVYEDDEMLFGIEDTQPELYAPRSRENVEFDKFNSYEKIVKIFINTFQKFLKQRQSFCDSIVYGLMYKIMEERELKTKEKVKLEKEKAREILGKNLYAELLEIKDEVQLDKTFFGYYNRSFIVNEVLSNHKFFLKDFERRDKFRFLIKKKLLEKMELQEIFLAES